ncbi:MAG: glutathione S-transferase N-terminal domain-containing protein [Gaiellaceae bacterium]
MAVKLHRCKNVWVKVGGHPCWRVQKALDEAGVEYELVPGPVRRSKRDAMEAHTGQRLYPAIEFENGTWLPRAVGGHGEGDPRGQADGEIRLD